MSTPKAEGGLVEAARRGGAGEFGRVIRLFTFVAVAVILVAGTTFAIVAQRSYRNVLADIDRLASTVAALTGDQVERSLQSATTLLEDLAQRRVGNALVFDLEDVERRIQAQTFIRGVVLTDAAGKIGYSSIGDRDLGKTIADLPFLKRLNDGSSKVVVGDPLPGRSFGDRQGPGFFPVAIAARDPSNRLIGYAAAVINPDFFQRRYSRVTGAYRARVTVYRFDGTVLVSSDASSKAGEVVARTDPIFTRYIPNREAGTFTHPPRGADGEVISFVTTPSFPVVVSVAFDRDDALAAWRREVLVLGAIGGVATFLVVIALVLIARQLRQAQAQAEETRRQEEAARNARAQLALAINSIADGFSYYDSDDRLVLANDAYRRIIGAASDFLVPGVPFETVVRDALSRGVFPDATGAEETWLRHRMERHRSPGEPVEQYLADGRCMRLLEQRTPDGGYLGLWVDVTPLKEREKQLRGARESAEAATAAKSEFLANMSHEIRTPLNGLTAMVELLIDSRLSPEQRLQAEVARGSAQQLLQIIGNILDMSKLEAGALELESIAFDLTETVESAAQTFAAQILDRDLEIITEIDPALAGSYVGDPVRLRQVLVNLIGNAVKFTRSGSVHVRVTAGATSDRQQQILFSVADTGPGLSEDMKARLFQRFAQADATTTRRFGGTGLGLAICRDLVQGMGGDIRVQSTEGWGATFAFDIRLMHADAAADRSDLAGRRILLVGGLPLADEALVRVLEACGASVERAADYAQAVSLCGKGDRFDTAILDGRIGTPTVFDLAAHIRGSAGTEPCRLILASPLSLPGADGYRGRMGLFDAIVLKPLRQTAILDAIRSPLPAGGAGDRANLAGAARRPVATGRIRVLIVEDNEVNRFAFVSILERAECAVEVATDGVEGAAAAEREAFDLILMDLQMPNLDGLGATRRIRTGTGPNRTTPIYALTANAFIEDVRNCIAAGMNGHLAKPLRRDALAEVLATVSPPEVQSEDAPVDLAYLAEWEAETPAPLAQRLVGMFLSDGPERLARFRAMAEVHNAADASREAHSLKDVARMFGANRLAERAATMERVAQAGEWDAVDAGLPRLAQECETVLAFLRDRFKLAA